MAFTKKYAGENLDHLGFPLGGIGAGMFNVEGTGSFGAFSLRNEPDVNLEPCLFAAVTVKGEKNISRVIEGQVPKYKIYGGAIAPRPKKRDPMGVTKANGLSGTSYGLPRFTENDFQAKFPFARLNFTDEALPLQVSLKAWSPFTPPNPDDSSYPAAFLEYSFANNTDKKQEAVFYYSSMNFMAVGEGEAAVRKNGRGFVLSQSATEAEPWLKGDFCAFIDDPAVKVNTALFRGGWFDSLTMLWNDIESGLSQEKIRDNPGAFPNPGASLSLAFALNPGETKTIVVNCCWYVPDSRLRIDRRNPGPCYKPWYSAKFDSIETVAAYMAENRERLCAESQKFSDTFFASTLPEIVLEAVSANTAILKTPTVLRQTDGRFWCWEGCTDDEGSCSGSCTHVWNYAQAVCNLFPSLERSLRQTEFFDSQNEEGHQNFRAALPIGEPNHNFHPAADGQLGGIIKLYRDFTICGDVQWLAGLWDRAKASIDYCIGKWDKKSEGVLREPHHNTYDIEFWGPDGMCTSFYLGALSAMIKMGEILDRDCAKYRLLLEKGIQYMGEKLYNGEYFIQQTQWEGLEAQLPKAGERALNDRMSEEAAALMKEFGPKYQYGTGCISDGVLGFFLTRVAGLEDPCASDKIKSHLNSVYRYNLRESLLGHANPQRPGYCVGDEAGLLLCSWPHGNKPALPFVYSDEVWTGIEYQVAAHLIFMGETQKGLDIVTKCRSRYQGDVRNPFDEYECGHWYARAMASYALLQALTGIRYDAYKKELVIAPKIQGDFDSFLATDTGYGLAGIKNGQPYLRVVSGTIPAEKIIVE